jgi:hypothetical protein
VPKGRRSEGELACDLAAAYGLVPDPHQQDVLKAWLTLERDGRWAAAVCGWVEPRQNGKNAGLEIRELYGMVILGERFLHTAHQVKTARKAWRRVKSFFEAPHRWPELAELVKEKREVNGQEALFLTNGGSIEFIARSRNSGRGFDGIDVLVCDEAQDLTDEEQAALLPTISAATLGNPQVIFTGTPPDPEAGQTGEVFVRTRDAALRRDDPRLCWIEYGVPDGPLPDVTDRRAWARANPALGTGRLLEAEVERELALMSPETFARERLGWWGEPIQLGLHPIEIGDWLRLALRLPDRPSDVVFFLDCSPDLMSAAIAACGMYEGRPHVELADFRPGVDWMPARAAELSARYPGAKFASFAASATSAMLPKLVDAGLEVEQLTGPDMGRACGHLQAMVARAGLTHDGDPAFTKAIGAAVKQFINDDMWKWSRRRSGGDICPLVAATGAAWLLEMQPVGQPSVYAI